MQTTELQSEMFSIYYIKTDIFYSAVACFIYSLWLYYSKLPENDNKATISITLQ